MDVFYVEEAWMSEAFSKGLSVVECACGFDCTKSLSLSCVSYVAKDKNGVVKGIFKTNMKYGYFTF